MKKETIKEFGKYVVDISKIIFAVALISPLVQKGRFEAISAFLGAIAAIIGFYLINKGVKDE